MSNLIGTGLLEGGVVSRTCYVSFGRLPVAERAYIRHATRIRHLQVGNGELVGRESFLIAQYSLKLVEALAHPSGEVIVRGGAHFQKPPRHGDRFDRVRPTPT